MKVNPKNDFTTQQGRVVDSTGLSRKGGFTLLEVIAGLAIIMLLIGGVYGIANGALELGVRSSESRKVAVREMNFSTVLRTTFSKPGPDVRVQLSPKRLDLSGERGMLELGGGTAMADHVAFEFRFDDASNGAIWVSHFRNQQQVSEIRLIDGFTDLFWECQDPVSGNWVRNWNVTGDVRPALIRLRTIRGQAESTEVFWIPNFGEGRESS